MRSLRPQPTTLVRFKELTFSENFSEKLIEAYPNTLIAVNHQRMYTANGVSMVMLGTDILHKHTLTNKLVQVANFCLSPSSGYLTID